MKRLHVHLGVADPARSVAFYSNLFDVAPEVKKADYAERMLDDAPGKSGEGLVKYLDEVANVEDYEVIEAQFNGLASRAYNQGRLVVDEKRSIFTEEPLYRWHSTYLKTLGELDGLPE